MPDVDKPRGTVSLLTIMAYLEGGTYDLEKLFYDLPYHYISDPPKRKNGSVDVKKISVLADKIVSIQWGQYIKGIETISGEALEKIRSEGLEYEITVKKSNGKTKVYKDIYDNIYNYKNVVHFKRPGDRKNFPHQITLIYSCQPGININMFIFRQSMKISGFKNQIQCEKMVKRLWKKYLSKIEKGVIMETENLGFIFESTMINTKFKTPFKYKLTKVNTLINRIKELEGDDTNIIMSRYETTGDTGVTIELKSDKPEDYTYNKWTWRDNKFYGTKCKEIKSQRKTDDQKKTTISLYDYKYLMSFRYGSLVEETSKFFDKILKKYSDIINVTINDDIKRYKPTLV